MTHRVKWYSLPLLALLLAATACNSGAPGANGGGAAPASGGNTAAAGSSSAGAAAISADDKPHDVLMKAMRGQLDAKSYRVHVTTSMGGGPSNNIVIEYAAPDRYRMVIEVPGGKQEFVIAGNAAYIKAPNGQWVRSPVGVADLIKQFRDPKMLEEMAKTTDIKLVGPDTVDGTPTLVYQYTQNNVMGMNMKSTAKTWLAVADGLPRKTEAEGEYDGKPTKTLMTITDYNSDIKIEAPVK
ncbi:MAG TPA: hypothetical protein VF240_19595 [Pyrinomonadaceae bacterium]